MKKKACIISLVAIGAIILAFLVHELIFENTIITEQRRQSYTEDALAYLDGQLDQPSSVNIADSFIENGQDGKIIGMHLANNVSVIQRLKNYISNAEQISRVGDIPELEYPVIQLNDRISGNFKKIYYSCPYSKTIVEFTLNSQDSMGFLLYITEYGTPYQEVLQSHRLDAIKYLKQTIAVQDKDIITSFPEGQLESVEVHSQVTLNKIFQCINNCKAIYDITDDDCSLPVDGIRLVVNGVLSGNETRYYYTYPDTGRRIDIVFEEEDSEDLHDYLNGLVKE